MRARAIYDAVPLYDPKRTPVDIDLTDNTNLWGMPPHAREAWRAQVERGITRYPSLYASELKETLAARLGHGITPSMVVTGCGSDDLLDSAMRAFAAPDDVVAASLPSFAMIPIFAQMNGLRYTAVPERAPTGEDADGAVVDVPALLAQDAQILYLSAPNNPTGRPLARATLRAFLDGSRGLVILDEAYAEFAGEHALALVHEYPQLLIVRTMSKAWGLAGLRVGYAIAQPDVALAVEKSRGPYKVNAVAERVATVAVRDDAEWVTTHIDLAIANRERLAAELRSLSLSPLPSAANFVCVPMANVERVSAALRRRGVAARPFAALPHVGDALRISVGPWPMVQALLDALPSAIHDAQEEGTNVR
jgi:histidinol-phosphate aminotransferase